MTKRSYEDNLPIQSFKKIKETETLGHALSLFDKSTDILVVLNQKKIYTGILMIRSILRTDLDPEKTKVKSFKIRAPKVSQNIKIQDCARLMIENNIMYLPVFDRDKVMGIISYLDLLRLPEFQRLGRQPVKDIMAKSLTTASSNENMANIYHKFKESDLFSIPVVEKGKYKGMIHLHDTISTIIQHKSKPDFGTKLGEKEHLLELPVENIITYTSISAKETENISQIVNKIIENELDCISIIDDNNQFQSVVTVKDLLRLIADQDQLVSLARPNIQINSKIENINRDRVEKTINNFIKKFGSILGGSDAEIYIREHREKKKHQKLIYTRIYLHAHHNKFDATAEDWGVEQSLKQALEKIERQVLKKKPSKKHSGKRKY